MANMACAWPGNVAPVLALKGLRHLVCLIGVHLLLY